MHGKSAAADAARSQIVVVLFYLLVKLSSEKKVSTSHSAVCKTTDLIIDYSDKQ